MSGDVRLPAIAVSSTTERMEESEQITSGTRTPRPYYHEGDDILQDYTSEEQRAAVEDGGTYETYASGLDSTKRQRQSRSGQVSTTASDSGTEADDERPTFVKAITAPHLRPRKGLKTGEANVDVLLTPSQLDDEGRRLSQDYFKKNLLQRTASREEQDAEEERLRKIRLAEFARRSSETGLMILMILCVLCGKGVVHQAYRWRWELLCHVAVITGLVLAYPLKLSVVDGSSQERKIWQRFRVPASFDPATILYPTLLPVLVALSVAPANSSVILPNIVLGLSSLPQRLFPRSSRLGGFNVIHWFISILPLLVAAQTHESYDKDSVPMPPSSRIPGNRQLQALSPETLVSLYPLHFALLSPLHYLTTTSLLVSELHLLSAALINILLLAQSPQMVMLKACLWIGGVPIFVLCSSLLNWNVTLMRVPKWKFRRSMSSQSSLRSKVVEAFKLGGAAADDKTPHSDADEDEKETPKQPYNEIQSRPQLRVASTSLTSCKHVNGSTPQSAVEAPTHMNGPVSHLPPPRRPRSNTLPTFDTQALAPKPRKMRSLDRSSKSSWCLDLTATQALHKKVTYAILTFVALLAVILVPVRYYVLEKALEGNEPIGWALGYLFGQVPSIRATVFSLDLQDWMAFPSEPISWPVKWQSLPLNMVLARQILGAANVRLLLIGYWAAVLMAGLLAVFSLTAYVEVDTRRKVFHGVMVAMMLPSTFVDPCACALALTLILAVFLLLEVIRAGQIFALGNAIGRFVAPYVDGRDLRGPVVVSHIFLLIGCAVPLWFSLASIARAGSWPWAGWELAGEKREVAMVAGVICVGMGDAAASLIGRRYGRRKWIWVGGKSLEGSAAFAVAVTIGLVAAKVWLVVGGWQDFSSSLAAHQGALGAQRFFLAWQLTLVKAVFCACGASFMEAILTGANDNVVVPIALWLMVKGVRL